MQRSVRALLALMLVCTVPSLMASTTAIGFAAAQGSFQVNSTDAQGTATLFEGSVVETGKAPSTIQLGNGAQIRLAMDSRAKIFESRLVLEKGAGQIEGSSAYPIESRTLRVTATAPNTVARIRLSEQGKVLVATVRGSVRVTNSAGLAVADVTGGLSMAFDPQVGASAPAKLAGCIYEHDGTDFIFDSATKIARGLKGSALSRQVGKNLEISGLEDPATHLIDVTAWKPLAAGQCAKFAKLAKESGVDVAVKTVGIAGGAAGAAAGAAAAGAAAGGAAAGASIAATVAVVGGVAAASTVGGLAAAGSFSSSNNQTNSNPPTSR
jgi:hypothetical protein